MADPFVAEIRIFPFNFAPKGWAFCSGQILPISQNTALFSLLGVTYGGNGTTNFALPNTQGNAPLAPGQGPGLSLYDLGETIGSPNVTLLQNQIPQHNHPVNVGTQDTADVQVPSPTRILGKSANAFAYVPGSPAPTLTQMNATMIGMTGGNLPHNNMQPYLTLNFCIALQGVFPARG
ncbi:phage tail protein [Bradyrhizobium australafricanum]|uniref:phage tail protein n=1 Tax=Bradyrhizobium australafricanum TaxID=2821406 RepID=UPI001CE3B1E8|nr:tail fiber protein [Bradyrhizobium australafricanum]MCA6098058.1 phage tail protein [Bradyrhizobium australafricanum]